MKEFDISAVWPEWEIVGTLGKGPFGAVYLIERKDGEKPVYSAVKVITVPPDRSAVDNAAGQGIGLDELKSYFDKFKSDLNWELTMCSSASSPYIAETHKLAVVDTEDWPGWSAYIRMPVLTPLPVYFAKAKAGPEEAVRLGREICTALEVFGRFGLIHGAVHPGNVMVKDGGDFVLSDFGVRRCLKRAGSGLFGDISNEYEAPEIKEGGAFSTAADIYSLGMMMSYVFCGGVLPDGELHCGKKIDPRLIDIIRKATAQEPMERYISAAAMLDDLNKLKIKEAKHARMAPAAITALGTARKNAETVKKPAEPEIKPAEAETAGKEVRETAEELKRTAAEIPSLEEIDAPSADTEVASEEEEKESAPAAEMLSEEKEKEPAPAAETLSEEKEKEPAPAAETLSEEEEKESAPAAETLSEEKEKEPVPAAETLSEEEEKEPAPAAETLSEEEEKEPAPVAETLSEEEEKEPAPVAETLSEEKEKEPAPAVEALLEEKEKKQEGEMETAEIHRLTTETETEEAEEPSSERAEKENIAASDEKEKLAEKILAEDVIKAVEETVSKDKKLAKSGAHLKKSRDKREKKQLGLYPTVVISFVIVTIVIIASLLIVRPWEKAGSNSDAGTMPPVTQSEPSDTEPVQQEPGQNEQTSVPQTDPEPAIEPEPISEPAVPAMPDVPVIQEVPEDEISGYILPTDAELISDSDLEGMTRKDTYMVINEIYARHGKIFKTESIQEYFENQSWYEPVTADSATVYSKFSDIERENLKTIVKYQKQVGYREW
ncbi:MAG: YARHG domain-containing protein [Oscillospiraceae bacterium]